MKLYTTLFVLLMLLSVQALAQEPKPTLDSLQDSPAESFILVPTAAASPFPAFYLVDTTLSTLVVDDGLSIQVELHKVDFMAKTDYKNDTKRKPKEEIAALPPRKDLVIQSTSTQAKKITL